MVSRNWLSWLMGCVLISSTAFQGSAQAQYGYGDYGYNGGYSSGTGGGEYIPMTPPGPYDYPIEKSGRDPYWVAPTPETPQIFSSGDATGDAFRSWDGFFFRAEYLQLDYTRPGDVALGAPQFTQPNLRDPFQVFDNSTVPPTSLGFAQVPVLDTLLLNNNQGFRATAGIPLIFGSAEANIFKMSEGQTIFQDSSLDGTLQNPFLGTTTLVNGQVNDNIELYNDSFRAVFNSKLWGAETNIFFDGPSSNFFSFGPMVGFRYIDFREDLLQTGSFIPNPTTGLPTVVTNINSYSTNQIFTPQIGYRTKFENSFMMVTFDPKFGLGANVYRNRVSSQRFRSTGDPLVETEDSAAALAPVIDLGVTGALKLTPSLRLTVGYNFLFVSRVTRPQDNIRYNDNGPLPTLPGIVVDTHKQDVIFQGLTVGAEFRR